MFKLDRCTFFMEREQPSLWLLSYHTNSGHYHYARGETAKQCATLLNGSDWSDEKWVKLHERVPALVLPANITDLTNWIGIGETEPQKV